MPSTPLSSRSPVHPPTEEDARVFLTGVCLSIGLSQTYEHTLGKRVLWMIFMGVVSECSEFHDQCMDQSFLGYALKVFNCKWGIAVATVRDYQMTLNLFIPCTQADSEALYDWMAERLKRDFYDYSIDLRPILRFVQFPHPHTWRRTMLPSVRRLEDLAFDAEAGVVRFEDYATRVIEIIHDPARLSEYRPIRRMTATDGAETCYWHRFPCGTIVGFHNPQVDLHATCRAPRLKTAVMTHLTPICKKVVRALDPQCAAECIDIIETECITMEVRRLLVMIHRSRFGISDELIVAVGTHLGDSVSEKTKNLLLAELCIVYRTVHRVSVETASYVRLLEGLVSWLERFQMPEVWRRWLLTSPCAHALVDALPTSSMRRVCQRYPVLYHLMAATLSTQHPVPAEWSRETIERAHMICESSLTDGFYMNSIRLLYEQWERSNREAFDALSTACTESTRDRNVPLTSSSSVASAMGELQEISLDEESTNCAVIEETTTHDDIATRIASEILQNRFECTLIGSGIFYNGGDVDLVVHVPDADSLESAYDTIQALTGWVRHYDRVSADHIAVLCGYFEGVKVDAQVWRGVHALERTRAEDDTHRALLLTRTLREKTDDRLRSMVHGFHTYMTHVGLKGHVLCRLPGVAVTCMAIAVARTGNVSTVRQLLENTRERLHTDVPCFDLSDEEPVCRERVRPTCSVQVVVNETNVATRVTACVTRHLLDTMSWSLHHGLTESPRAWRTRHMITCLRMRPHDTHDRTLALTLHTTVARMDGHPLIETVYLGEHAETRDILVHVTLRNDARYAFRGGETISRIANVDSIVMVGRGGGTRQWMLCTHPCACASSLADSVSDASERMFVRVDDEVCVPNAPHIMNDMLGYFDNRRWMRVDV